MARVTRQGSLRRSSICTCPRTTLSSRRLWYDALGSGRWVGQPKRPLRSMELSQSPCSCAGEILALN